MSTTYVIVFRSRLRPGVEAAYADHAAAVYAIAQTMPGLLSSTDFTADDGERCTIVEFDSAEHLRAWREHPVHAAAQAAGRERYYTSYSIQVCTVERSSEFDAATGRWQQR